jgi:hypothetical protein
LRSSGRISNHEPPAYPVAESFRAIGGGSLRLAEVNPNLPGDLVEQVDRVKKVLKFYFEKQTGAGASLDAKLAGPDRQLRPR